LLGADEEDELVLTELGTDRPGEIAPLSKIAQPDVAVITTVAPAHLEGFGSIEAILEEKLSISQGLKVGRVLIINGDNGLLVKSCESKKIKLISFGESAGCDIRAQNIRYEGNSSRFTIVDWLCLLPGQAMSKMPGGVRDMQSAITAEDFADGVKRLVLFADGIIKNRFT
jgi:UDP-N-acetylmuramyl pentapeptide synthase